MVMEEYQQDWSSQMYYFEEELHVIASYVSFFIL